MFLRGTFAKHLTLIALIFGMSCQASNRTLPLYSEVRTDLGPSGNQLVADEFAQYKSKAGGCLQSTNSQSMKRVIVSGFGPFQSNSFNISGVVAGTMGNSALWNGIAPLSSGQSASTSVSPGTISATEHGAKASVRTITVNGRSYLACFLVLDVKWDLAGAIISYESQRFSPNMVIMMGRGASGAILEGGAINRATQLNGFDSSGNELGSANIPSSTNALILSNHADVNGAPHSIAMTWSNEVLRSTIQQHVEALGQTISAAPAARPSNNYICNNVSYVVLSALAGESISLAGGRIVIPDIHVSGTKAGFLHLPYSSTNQRAEVIAWAEIVALMIDKQLNG